MLARMPGQAEHTARATDGPAHGRSPGVTLSQGICAAISLSVSGANSYLAIAIYLLPTCGTARCRRRLSSLRTRDGDALCRFLAPPGNRRGPESTEPAPESCTLRRVGAIHHAAGSAAPDRAGIWQLSSPTTP